MSELSFNLGEIIVTPFYLGLALAVVFSSFSFWRKLKEDYHEEEIFTLSLLIFVSSLIFSAVFYRFLGFPALGAFLGVALSLFVKLKLSKKSVWEGYDALTFSWIYFALFGGLGLFLAIGDYLMLSYAAAGLLGGFWYWFMKKKYRSFGWYKSGKLGFLFWAESAFFSLFFSGLAFLRNNTLYCYEGFVWLVLFFACFVVIYIRSERSAKEDLKRILKIFKKHEQC